MDAGRDERPHLVEAVVELAGADPRRQLGVVAQPSARSRSACASDSAGSSASSRSSIRRALVATRAWNDSRPSVPLRTSPSTHSRTASSSSAIVGRSCTLVDGAGSVGGAPLERRAGQQAEHVPLVLAHPPTDRGELHRARRAAEVAPRLHDADDAPLERAEHLPPAERLEVDRRAAGRLVGRRPAPRGWRRRPPGSGEPNRHARTQNQPRSSIGSPRWASSQSRTACSPSGSTSRLPSRKSPWTTRGSFERRPVRLEPAEARARRPGAARRARRARRGTARPGRLRSGPSTASVGMRWTAAIAAPTCAPSRARAVAHSSSRRSLRAIVSPSSRSTTMPGAAEHRRRRRPRRTSATGTPAARRRPEQRRLGRRCRSR